MEPVLLFVAQAGLNHSLAVRSRVSVRGVGHPLLLELSHLLQDHLGVGGLPIGRSPEDHAVEDNAQGPDIAHMGILGRA